VSDHGIVDEKYNLSDDNPLEKNSNETHITIPTIERNAFFDNQSRRGTKPSPVNKTNLVTRLSMQSEKFSSNVDSFPGTTIFNNHYYRFFSIKLTWYDAKIECETLGGHLVTITSYEENNFVTTLAKGNKIWIGFTDERVEGEWEWVTNEPVNYTNWNVDSPDNAADGEDYAEMYGGTGRAGEWNDYSGPDHPNYSQPFICEWDFIADNSSIDPFIIRNNPEFEEVAINNSWRGNGSVVDPYIIENHTIYGYFYDSAIRIRNTTVHFIIRNCTLVGGTSGLILSNVTNGDIHNTTIMNTNNAVYLENSANCFLANNKFNSSNSREQAIIIQWSENNSFVNNTFENTDLVLLWSGYNAIIENSFTDSGITIFGWILEHYVQEIVTGNVVNNKPIIYWLNQSNRTVPTEAGQIYLVNCTDMEVYKQQISNTAKGISVHFSNFVNIVNNNISVNAYEGIMLQNTDNSIIQNNTVYDNSRDGISIIGSTNSTILNNSAFDNGWTGIVGVDCTNINLSSNNCYSNELNGIHLVNVSNSNFVKNICNNNFQSGIEIWNSQNNNFTSNFVFSNIWDGFRIENTNSSVYANNSASHNEQNGIYMTISTNYLITNNTLSNNFFGIASIESMEIEISNNRISSNRIGMIISDNSGVFLAYNRIEDSLNSIYIHNSNNCTFSKNSILYGNKIESDYGIHLVASDNIIIQENTFIDVNQGIHLEDSHNCIITKNVISQSTNAIRGIILEGSVNNRISDNLFNDAALFLIGSGNNSIFDNIFIKYGISLNGYIFEHFLQTEVFNNVLDGDPIIFWQHENDLLIPLEAQQVFLVNCTKIEVRNLNPSGIGDGIFAVFCDNIIIKSNILTRTSGYTGILLFNTNNSLVSNNRVSNYSHSGIRLEYAENITIIDNTVINNTGTGIVIDNSKNIVISKNNCSSNHDNGFSLSYSYNITISGNRIGFNQGVGVHFYFTTHSSIYFCIFDQNLYHGLYFDQSSNFNELFLNDFIYNNPEGVSQAYDDGGYNIISNNYWNEWVTPDINDDGIVDVSYIIEGVANNFDPSPRAISSVEKFYEPIPLNVIFGIAFLLLISIGLLYLSRKKEG
jgi:parallel beta-helix repeat protein